MIFLIFTIAELLRGVAGLLQKKLVEDATEPRRKHQAEDVTGTKWTESQTAGKR